MDPEVFQKEKAKAKALYQTERVIYSPYFKKNIYLTQTGFRHLQVVGKRKREHNEQLFKLKFLRLGLEIIKTSSTIQEYRTGEFHDKHGLVKQAKYWGMIAIIGKDNLKIRVVLRRVGNGKITFWSVMPYSKIKNGRQKIYEEGLETW